MLLITCPAGPPEQLYLIPSLRWKGPVLPFQDKDYEGKKSKPEWGLVLSRGHLPQLEEYLFDRMVHLLMASAQEEPPPAVWGGLPAGGAGSGGGEGSS